MGPYIYVWNRADSVTDDWHPEGGVVVVADSLAAAREVIARTRPECGALKEDPDHVLTLAEAVGKAFMFRNTGCC